MAVSDLEQNLQEARLRVRQLEQRLVEQRSVAQSREDLLATVVSHAPLILWSIDKEGVFTLSEGRGLSALGKFPGEAVGQSIFEWYRDCPAVLEQVRRALAGVSGSYLTQLGDRWFENWLSPTCDSTGAITGVVGVATDVTARQRAELAQRALGERFQHVFQSSPVGSIVTDLDTGLFLDANPAFCKLLGYRREELVGRTSLELGVWRDQTVRREALCSAFQRNAVLRAEHRLRTKSGSWRTVRFASQQIEIDGRACLLTILHDATREKRWEIALRRSYLRYRQLARSAPVGIFRASRTQGWTFANRQLAQIWGCERQALRGDGWLNAVFDNEREQVQAAYRRACEAGIPLSIEFRVQSTAETFRWVLVRLEPHVDQGTFLGTAIDITQRMQTSRELEQLNTQLESRIDDRTELLMRANQMLQEQIYERRRAIELLEESQERWRSLVQNAPDMILFLNRDRTIGFINHTRGRPSLSPDTIVGRDVMGFLTPESWPLVEHDFDRVFNHGETVTHEVGVPDDTGAVHWFQNRLAPVVRNGKVTGATVVCREVTEFKRAAEELRQTQDRLVHVARVTSVGEMTAALAHELNQPLAAIANYVRGCMIRLEADGATSAEILETMQAAVDEAHRASEVIRRLRQFLQRQELQREFADLNEVVQDAVRLAEPAFRRHQTQARLSLASDLPPVFVDRVQIIQVVLNLLLNAAESMAADDLPGREVFVETFVPADGRLVLSVTDSGPGVPRDLGDTIFDAFVTTKRGGLGMGLSISRTILEAHQGALYCEALEAPRGARFVVTLPVCELKAASS